MEELRGYDSWRTQTPAEERGGDSTCDMCERPTWNDEHDGRTLCDSCLKETDYEEAVDRIRKGEY